MAPHTWRRLSSPDLLVTPHVSPDSRFVLLPVLPEVSTIAAWVVYDTTTGTIVHTDESFDTMHQARAWVDATYPTPRKRN